MEDDVQKELDEIEDIDLESLKPEDLGLDEDTAVQDEVKAKGMSKDEALDFIKRASPEELAASVMKNADYTQKTQAVARQSDGLDAKERTLQEREQGLKAREAEIQARADETQRYHDQIKTLAAKHGDMPLSDLFPDLAKGDTKGAAETTVASLLEGLGDVGEDNPLAAKLVQGLRTVVDKLTKLEQREQQRTESDEQRDVQAVKARMIGEIADQLDAFQKRLGESSLYADRGELEREAKLLLNEHIDSGDLQKGVSIGSRVESHLKTVVDRSLRLLKAQADKRARARSSAASAREGSAGPAGKAEGLDEFNKDLGDWDKDPEAFHQKLAERVRGA